MKNEPTQKEYSLSLTLQVVQSIEQGLLSTTGIQRKYGIQTNYQTRRLSFCIMFDLA